MQKCLAGVLALVCGTVKWTSRFVIFRKNNLEKDAGSYSWQTYRKRRKSLFLEDGAFEELSGYYIYFAKNPQMQEYMLREQKEISGEADYEDEVTDAIRSTIRQKKTRQERMQMVAWSAGVILFFIGIDGS